MSLTAPDYAIIRSTLLALVPQTERGPIVVDVDAALALVLARDMRESCRTMMLLLDIYTLGHRQEHEGRPFTGAVVTRFSVLTERKVGALRGGVTGGSAP